ncbi:hypothetical protein IQ264_27460 [Phormidium sp. LEGE 05292]|uniref:hypothetical protein n=1 Tax=[Phormidium] sp. LEGE 05292 TaxID=767427 RepID=UPI001880C350|nr:hypothetical protein [Phormidium sp. LEGE 05292]MBE9229145.1 hypothetical protein [Phormidium sp. LEGE 05292]
MGKTKLRKVGAYIDHDLYADFEKLAKVEMRSISSMTQVAIKEIVDKAKADGKL